MASTHSATQKRNFDSSVTKLQQSSFKTFHRKTYLTQFHENVGKI